VYVIIGGAGGIGMAYSRELIQCYRAQVIWIGRRPMDARIASLQQELAAFGPAPEYLQADAGDRAALAGARRQVRERHAPIDGIVHAAIVLADASLSTMNETTFRAALSAKVDVSVRLAQVFRGDAPDFVLFFSSMQSSLRSAGQSNYAAGCTFNDALAHALDRQWHYARTCRPLCLNT
jgi:polyketide synthase PksN